METLLKKPLFCHQRTLISVKNVSDLFYGILSDIGKIFLRGKFWAWPRWVESGSQLSWNSDEGLQCTGRTGSRDKRRSGGGGGDNTIICSW